MNYIVNLPTGTEITLGLPYGSVVYKHGDIVPESYITKSFPQYFSPLGEVINSIVKPQPVDDIIRKIKESIIKESNKEDKPKESKPTEFKKSGRPPKKGFSKG
jgi:hypothetical protein